MYRVLVVDDEPIHRREMAKLVRSLRNEYTVEEAENGKAALEMINNSKYNILITDVKMPVMDGLQLLESIEEKASHMKIVVLSGYDYFEYAKGAIKFGACDYILKPVDPETVEMMLRRVEKLLKEQEENDALSYFILDMRMQKAVFLLQNSEKKIYEIAEKVGFRDVKYFCKVFKSKFGVTPNHYRIFAGKGGYVK